MKELLDKISYLGDCGCTKKFSYSKVRLREIVCENETDLNNLKIAFKRGYIGQCALYGFRLTKKGLNELIRLEGREQK